MTCRRAVLFFTAIFLLATVPASAQQWTQVHSPNFTVVTDGNVGQARDLLNRLEQMRGVFGSMFHRTKINIPVPLQVIAFRSAGELKASAPLVNGAPLDVPGFYQGGQDRNFIALDLTQEDKWSVVFHDYAHMLLNANYPRTQPWFDEGFSEYFAFLKVTNKELEIGQSPSHAALLGSAKLMPVTELFGLPPDSKVFSQPGPSQQLFYAQSWLVVCWVSDSQKMQQLAQYFDLTLRQKRPIAEAITRAFGMEPAEFDRVILDYFRAGRGTARRVPAPVAIDPVTFSVTRLSSTQAQAIVADLRVHTPGHSADAINEFKQVLEKEPDNQVAHRGLGIAYLLARDLEPATEHLQRAVKLNENDPRAHYYYAVLLNNGSQSEIQSEARTQQMIFELRKAVQLDPQYSDAYNLLASAELSMNHPDEAMANMRRAIEFAPRNEHYLLNLAQLQILNAKYTDARGLLAHLQTSDDATVASRATQIMNSLEVAQRQQTNWKEQGVSSYKDPTDPRWQAKENPEAKSSQPEEDASTKPDTRKVDFLKGTILAVDCSATPGAVLTVGSGGKHWKFKTPDRSKLILINADAFSCAWKDIKVAVNYKAAGADEGDLVSLELQ